MYKSKRIIGGLINSSSQSISSSWTSQNSKKSLLFRSLSRTTSSLTVNTALKLLKLSQRKSRYSPKELRDAYFTAAKYCHPDSSSAKINANEYDEEEKQKECLTNQFHAITEAYELLQNKKLEKTHASSPSSSSQDYDHDHDYITKSEEENFRQACQEFLGVDADIVEESKRCPLFREWLKGRTVDAFLWNLFLMRHGGLAPMLRRKKTFKLAEGHDKSRSTRRRKR
jgi:hypothetical protein